jgi:RNA-directed DNA polymerase
MANLAQIRAQSIVFQAIKNVRELANLLGESSHELSLLALKPHYHVFEIPKKNGKKRIIEAPDENLKKVLQKINDYLQAVYYAKRPSAVYGFCISHTNEEDRNIVSNAKRHIGKKYLLNIDFQDFFHDISFDKVHHIFAQHFPKQKPELTRLLTMLCCFRERLPMGSPTSPVLSNFACLDFDAEMMEYCKLSGITYTRFADDLSFSTNIPLRKSDERFFRELITHYDFRINEEKVCYFEEQAEKMVRNE